MNPRRSSHDHADRRSEVRGTAAGGLVFGVAMLLLAGATVWGGGVPRDAAGVVDLRPWLWVECIGGCLAGALAGRIARGVSRGTRAATILAGIVLVVGLLEAAEIARQVGAGRVAAPLWLVSTAPLLAAAAVLLGANLSPRRWYDACISPLRSWPRATGVVRSAAPLAILSASIAVAAFAIQDVRSRPDSQVVAAALTVDFTMTFPAAVFLAWVRPRRAPWQVLLPAVALGFVLANVLIPAQHHSVLDALRWLLVPAELTVLAYVCVLARRAFAEPGRAEGDFPTRVRTAARRVLGHVVPADILTTEVCILYYAFRWPSAPRHEAGSFTMHREVSYRAVILALAMVLVSETIALHLFVSHWSSVAAWALTALSGYAGLWLLGDFRAISQRLTRVESDRLLLRLGLRWEADIPLHQIAQAAPLRPSQRPPNPGVVVAALLAQPNIRLRLTDPVELIGMYGIRRRADEIWLRVDRAGEFLRHIEAPPVSAAGGSADPADSTR